MIRKFFFKRFKEISKIFLVPILILFLFMFILISKSTVSSINKEITATSIDVQSDIESLTSACFSQHDMLTLNVKMSLIMKKALQDAPSTYTEYVFVNSISTFLESVTYPNNLIKSIYMYLDGYNSYLSSEKPIALFATDTDKTWYEYYEKIPSNKSTASIVRTIPSNDNSKSEEVLTVYRRLSYLKGVLVANLPIEELKKSFGQRLPEYKCDYYLLDSDNRLLCSNSLNHELYENLLLRDDIINQPDCLKNKFLDGKMYKTYVFALDTIDAKYVLLMPFSTIFISIMSKMIWPLVMIVLVVMLTIALAYTSTRTSFRQIQYVIDAFANAEKGIYPEENSSAEPDNEYELIMNNVIALFLNTTFLNSQLAEHKYKKQAAELEALQLQINPHFMINTLQTVNFELLKYANGPSSLSDIVNNLSDILNYSLARKDEPVTITDELIHIHKYIEIQKYRFPNSFLYYEDIDDNVVDIPFKRLILQPLIENSISHGIRSTNRFGLVKVKIYKREDHIQIYVLDNGAGIAEERLKEIRENLANGTSKRIGLDNVNKRLVLTYGNMSALKIQSKEGWGTIISFCIPL